MLSPCVDWQLNELAARANSVGGVATASGSLTSSSCGNVHFYIHDRIAAKNPPNEFGSGGGNPPFGVFAAPIGGQARARSHVVGFATEKFLHTLRPGLAMLSTGLFRIFSRLPIGARLLS